MHKKQIITLGFVAILALLVAMVWQPSSSRYLGNKLTIGTGIHEASTSSSSTVSNTVINYGNFSTADKSDSHASSPALQTAPQPQQSAHTQPLSSVHVAIVQPNGTATFDVKLNAGDDLCGNLVQAKAEGKIISLLVDDSYLATFGSRYVREINGYSNNWTVEVNGVKPTGCSLYKPKSGDKIIWRFGV